ncbi:unnamed protein product [Mesocestoides corti]|uniref:Transcription initiation factor IIA subunit 1 n=2 Tax=Mesocestoides corti TaxID=53468 RepID=A0A0R3ULW0_MESCO|nr:unnamed protein product [Mesocestoides corti]
MTDVAAFYNGIIEDVINGMKETFTQEGIDLEVLEELKKLWSSKLAESHVADPEPAAQSAVHYAQRLQAAQYQACVGQAGVSIPIARLPIQPNTIGQPSAMRTLAPIARPNAPLTTATVANLTPAQQPGIVIRSAVGAPTGARQPIVLAAALNPQQQATQPRLANPVSIAIRAPLQNAAGQTTIIGQPGLPSVNGVQTLSGIPGQNVQILQLGQQTFMVPFQFRPQLAGAQQLHQDATGTTVLQTQAFNRTQVDGGADSDFDDGDDDLDPYSVESSSLRPPVSVTTPRSVLSRPPGTVQPPQSQATIDDDDDDDEDMVVATPGVGMMTPDPGSVFVTGATIPRQQTGVKRQTSGLSTGGKQNAKRIRHSSRGDFGDDYDEGDDEDLDDEDEFGSVATMMTPAGQRLEGLAEDDPRSAPTSRRKQKTPSTTKKPDLVGTVSTPGGMKEETDDDHIPDLPPDDPSGHADPTIAAEEAAAEEEEDDDPLNSGDDVSDEEPESLFESENLVVCQYERVSRARSKWRFWLRDGIMKIRGRDHVFQKLIVEADW